MVYSNITLELGSKWYNVTMIIGNWWIKNGWYLYDELLEQYWVVQIGDIQFPQDFRFLKSPIGCDANIRGENSIWEFYHW